jgi:hypothetical protein
MYFFYLDETGNRDPRFQEVKPDGSIRALDHLYVVTAVGFYERRWQFFDREIANLKLELADHLYYKKRAMPNRLSLADCEVKSITLRNPTQRAHQSLFLHELGDVDRTRISELFFAQLPKHNMTLFSAVIDKRELRGHMDYELMHKMAYELILERIEQFLWTQHDQHNGLVIMDDTERQLNRAVAMKHAQFQREGNRHIRFKHIIEYPFFTDSRLSNGIQLADLCSYNIYRAFRNEDFEYSYFAKMLPFFYHRTRPVGKLDGLKVWPETSPLVHFASKGYLTFCEGRAG